MKKKTKILMIALQHCAKDDRIFYKEAKSLQKEGYTVSYLLLTDKSGYLRDMSGNILNPNKESVIHVDGIKIIGILPPQNFVDIYLKKVFLGSFQNSFVQAIINEGANIYHAHEPISLRLAFKAAKTTNKKVIYDAHESWISGTLKERIIKIKYLKKIKYLIAVNDGILKGLTSKKTPKYSTIIHNASLTNLFPTNTVSTTINTPVQLVHEGSLSFNRGLKVLLQALLELKKKYADINLKIIGGCPEKEKQYLTTFISKNNLTQNITITGWVDYENVNKHLKNCDIGLILYTPTPNNLLSTSNKLFNYIAASVAIISLPHLKETNTILKPLNNSIILEENTSQNLVYNITSLIQNSKKLLALKNNSVIAYKKHNWLVEEKKLLDFYSKVIAD